MNIDDDINHIAQALLDQEGEDKKKVQSTIYSFYDSKRPESYPFYKNDNSVSKMSELGLLKVVRPAGFNSKVIDTSTIRQYFFFDVEFLPQQLKEHLNKKSLEIPTASGKVAIDQKPEDKIYRWDKLELNVTQGIIQYYDSPKKEISTDTNEMKFLIFLFDNSRVVEYLEIAKHLRLNSYHEECTNQDMARVVQFVKRDLLTFLKRKLGMPEKEAKSMIITKRKLGLKLR